VTVEKTMSEFTELSDRLANTRREKKEGILIIVVYCLVAGIVMSQFLLIGVTFWTFVAFIFIVALLIHYQKVEAEIINKMNNMENRKN
jgi:hypothetical protein